MQKTQDESLNFWPKLQKKLTTAEFKKLTDAEYERCSDDYLYWRWQGWYCYSTEKGVGTNHLPKKHYNWLIASLLENREIRHKAWPKTRQMLMTWELSAYYVWFAQFHSDTENLVVNKKEDDSAYIVYRSSRVTDKKRDGYTGNGRCWTIYKNQPEWLRQRCPAAASHNEISFSNGSFIKGLPEGEEQLHQYQSSNTWFDEASRMSHFAARFFGGAAPMSQNVHVTSTPDTLDDFYRVVMDKGQESFMGMA